MDRRKIKKMKRRLKKKLYCILLAMNQFDFKKLRPVFAGVVFAALITAACLLPTTTKSNSGSAEAAYGSFVAASVRKTAEELTGLQRHSDVVAVFLPEDFSSLTAGELSKSLGSRTLYSFYLTGEELYTLAEGAAALRNSTQTLYLDGLDFTCHKNRLPFDRVTEASLSNGPAVAMDNTLYHVVSTEDIFSLFHYIDHRSLGLMRIYPKAADGTLLSDYRELVRTRDNQPLTLASVLGQDAAPLTAADTAAASTVTTLGGFNLIELWKSPNKVTILMVTLFFTMVILLWYAIPRIHRVRLWFRIYVIRSKKRGRGVPYGRRRTSSGFFRRAG